MPEIKLTPPVSSDTDTVSVPVEDFAELVDLARQAPKPSNDGAIILGASEEWIAADLERRRIRQREFVAEMAALDESYIVCPSPRVDVAENTLSYLVSLAGLGRREPWTLPVVVRTNALLREFRGARQKAEAEASANYQPQVGEIWSTGHGNFYRIEKVTATGLRLLELERETVNVDKRYFQSTPLDKPASHPMAVARGAFFRKFGRGRRDVVDIGYDLAHPWDGKPVAH